MTRLAIMTALGMGIGAVVGLIVQTAVAIAGVS